MSYDLGDKIRTGAIWTYIQSGGLTILQFATGIVMARILEPEDFGLFMAVTAYTTIISSQIYFGIPQALVQAKEISQKELNSGFWLMSLVACLGIMLVFGVAGQLELIYDDPRYHLIMFVMAAPFVVIPYNSIITTQLRRDMNFKLLAQIRIATTVLTIPMTIMLALRGYGPFALAMGGIITAMISTGLLALATRWYPSAPDLRSVRPMIKFAWKAHFNSVQLTLNDKVDNMLIGAYMGTAALGLYGRAYSLARLPVEQLVGSIRTLVFGSFAQIKDNPKHSAMMYRKSLSAIVTGVTPFLLLFMCLADDLIGLVYGEKWVPAADPLRIMAFGAIALMLGATLHSYILAQDLVGKEIPINLFGLLLTVVLVLLLYPYGLDAIAVGIVIKDWVRFYLTKRMTTKARPEITWLAMWQAIQPAFIASLFAIGAALAMQLWVVPAFPGNRLMSLALVAPTLLLTYFVVILYLAHRWRDDEVFATTMSLAGGVLCRVPLLSRLIPKSPS